MLSPVKDGSLTAPELKILKLVTQKGPQTYVSLWTKHKARLARKGSEKASNATILKALGGLKNKGLIEWKGEESRKVLSRGRKGQVYGLTYKGAVIAKEILKEETGRLKKELERALKENDGKEVTELERLLRGDFKGVIDKNGINFFYQGNFLEELLGGRWRQGLSEIRRNMFLPKIESEMTTVFKKYERNIFEDLWGGETPIGEKNFHYNFPFTYFLLIRWLAAFYMENEKVTANWLNPIIEKFGTSEVRQVFLQANTFLLERRDAWEELNIFRLIEKPSEAWKLIALELGCDINPDGESRDLLLEITTYIFPPEFLQGFTRTIGNWFVARRGSILEWRDLYLKLKEYKEKFGGLSSMGQHIIGFLKSIVPKRD